MGYYVIIDPEIYPMKYTYVEQADELVQLEGISKKSIIIESHAGVPPQQVGISIPYQHLAKDWYRAGLRAQALFAGMAKLRGLILEELSQDQESFKIYASCIRKPVKRGDFLVRNGKNTEIEVKCYTFYGRGRQKFFYFSEDDLVKHLNMQRATQVPVLVAVFQRKGDQPQEDTLCMISIDRIHELSCLSEAEKREYGRAFRIPLKETVPGMDLIPVYDLPEEEDHADVLEMGYTPYLNPLDETYVLVAYYKGPLHLEWIEKKGLYNFRMEDDRGAVSLGREESSARYILLHTRGETRTGRLYQILDNGPRVYSREMLIRKRYPGIPHHEYYLVYKVAPVMEKELQGRKWDISGFPGYQKGHNAALPFAVRLTELLK